MNTRLIILLITLVLMVSGAFAYSGFNREYYTNNYQPTYYYPTPYQSTYYSTSGYINSTPNYYYYPSTPYYPTYYNTYSTYYPTRSMYYNTYSAYPSTYRNVSIYKNDSGWGISVGSGSSICSIYGYC